MLLRLRPLPPAARDLAQAVAILGARAQPRHAAALAGLAREEATAAADALVAANILRDGRPLEFLHPLLRAAVLGELSAPRKAAEHAYAAQLLAQDGQPPDAVGAHLLATEPAGDEWTYRVLMSAAEDAVSCGVPEAAARFLERALEEPPPAQERAETMRRIGSALLTAGRARGLEFITSAREELSDPLERAQLAVQLADPLFAAGNVTTARALIDDALRELGAVQPDVELMLRAQRGVSLYFGADGTLPDALTEPERLAGELRGDSVLQRAGLARLTGISALVGEPHERSLAWALRALGDERAQQECIDAGYPPVIPLVALALSDQIDEALAGFDRAAAGVRRRGALALGLVTVLDWRAFIHRLRGALADAEVDARTALRLALPEFPLTGVVALSVAISVLAERGELAAAEQLMREHALADAAPPGIAGALFLHARGAVRLALRDEQGALADFLAAGERAEQTGTRNPNLLPWRSAAALAKLALGAGAEAQRLAEIELQDARRVGLPRAIGVALHALGLAERSVERLREAAAVLEGSTAALEQARVCVDLGATLRRRGERVAARKPLLDGMEGAHRCGATVLVERARDELRALGARPRSAVRSGVDALTASERRVTALAAQGATNREIAQGLFVTVKTVETHLRSAYRKLDIASRAELPGALR